MCKSHPIPSFLQLISDNVNALGGWLTVSLTLLRLLHTTVACTSLPLRGALSLALIGLGVTQAANQVNFHHLKPLLPLCCLSVPV